jgi:hypothetical protein
LQAQVQAQEERVTAMRKQLLANQGSQQEADSLKQQLADAQEKAGALQLQLNTTNSQADKINAIVAEYQNKLEAKDSAYNEQLKQIAFLNTRLHQKQVQIAGLRRAMNNVQQQSGAQEKDAQAKDLAVSIVEQKAMDDKLNAVRTINAKQIQEIADLKAQLALSQQELHGVPSSDEVEFLRTGLKKATAELSRKNQMLLSIKANADEYAKQFNEQSREFQSLKEQFEDAQEDIQRKDEDFKYKQMELIRFKEQTAIKEGDLEDQIKALSHKTHQPYKAQPKLSIQKMFFHGENDKQKVEILEDQLRGAQKQIDGLETELNQFQRGPAGDKLKQAMEKINSQGHVINVLVQKLQDRGEAVDLSRIQ